MSKSNKKRKRNGEFRKPLWQKPAMSPFSAKSAEVKHAITTSDTNAAATWTVFYIAGVAEGNTGYERTGNRIEAKDLTVWCRSQNTDNPSVVRIVIFMDRHNQGVMPTVTDVFDADQVDSCFDPAHRSRFTVLADTFLPASGYDNTIVGNAMVKIHRKLGFPIHYTGTTAAVASAGANGVFMAQCGTLAADDTGFYADLTFTDM